MPFILLTFGAALALEVLGSLISILGISGLFGANLIIIALAIALDLGKITAVSLLYTHFKTLPALMRIYAFLAVIVTMVITSTGAAGYLSGQFEQAIIGTKQGELKVSVLQGQQKKYEERKKQIDDQIANLPTRTTVSQRLRLINGFKAEQQELDRKIAEIDKELPSQQLAQINTEGHAGPILYIAKAFHISVEEAVKWVIGLIIFVFDPLAIYLIIAGNFLLAKRREKPTVNIWLEGSNGTPTPVPFVQEPSPPPAIPIKAVQALPATGASGEQVFLIPEARNYMWYVDGWEPVVDHGVTKPKHLSDEDVSDLQAKSTEPFPISVPPTLDEPVRGVYHPLTFEAQATSPAEVLPRSQLENVKPDSQTVMDAYWPRSKKR